MLEPGTFLLIDGRALNQRYLSSRLKRNWKWFTYEDRHLAYIDEEPLVIDLDCVSYSVI